MNGGSFVSEAIEPETEGMDPVRIARGEPTAPRAFSWRGERYAVACVLRTWKTYKLDRGERYVDRHWFEVALSTGQTGRLYCLRRERSGPRWFIFSILLPT